MIYDLQGIFYEACDCEVICSCWAGLPPEMGACTGLFVWQIEKGTVDDISVAGNTVAILSSGASCDDTKYMLVLVDGLLPQLKAAFTAQGAWNSVFQAQSFQEAFDARSAKITIIDEIGKSIAISITGESINKAEVSFTLLPIQMEGKKGVLADRVVGSAHGDIAIGVVDTPADPTKKGLNLLADLPNIPDPYTFDLDISRVSAVKGRFHYVKTN
jgi:hypothetical protein